MADKRDYYEVLGVSRDSDDKELKQAFRTLARKYHPDKNSDPDAADKFKEIQEAFAVLSDSDKRTQYDRFGHSAPGFGGGGFSGFDIRYEDLFGSGLEDIFSSFFGGGMRGGGRQRQNRGQSILVRRSIPFQMAMDGGSDDVSVDVYKTCNICLGNGAEDPSDVRTCSTCRGHGQVTQTRQLGPFMQQTTGACPDCNGQGKTISKPCKECDGEGRVRENQKIRFSVPAGVDTGMRLRMRGKGHAAKRGGISGDLEIELQLDEHPWFERDRSDLLMSLPVSYPDLMLGRKIELNHVDGDILQIKIPSNSIAGNTLTIRGRGLPNGRGHRGDVIVLLKLHMHKPDRHTKKMIEELRPILSLDDSEIESSVRDEAKDRRSNN